MNKGITCCPYTRTLLAGIVYGVISYIVGGVVWGGIFEEQTMAHAHLWRDMENDKTAKWMPAASVLIGIGLAFAFASFYKGIPGEGIKKGLHFGWILWLGFGLGGSVLWYTLSPVSIDLLIASLLDYALSLIIGGAAIAAVFGKLLDNNAC